MLINPSLETLLTKADSKFSIVSMVSKRVRELNSGWEPLIEPKNLKPVGIALEEIAEGKITMCKKEYNDEPLPEKRYEGEEL